MMNRANICLHKQRKKERKQYTTLLSWERPRAGSPQAVVWQRALEVSFQGTHTGQASDTSEQLNTTQQGQNFFHNNTKAITFCTMLTFADDAKVTVGKTTLA